MIAARVAFTVSAIVAVVSVIELNVTLEPSFIVPTLAGLVVMWVSAQGAGRRNR